MKLYLIRHGETEPAAASNFNALCDRPDPALNDAGIRQAERLGARLRREGIGRIFASDLTRARATAEILDRFLGVGVEPMEDLRETHMGRLHHCSWEDMRREDPVFFEAWQLHASDVAYPSGECGGDVWRRAARAVERIAARGHEKAAVVTHGGVIRTLVCGALGLGQEKRFLLAPPENTGVTVLSYDRETGGFTVARYNDAGHLEPREGP